MGVARGDFSNHLLCHSPIELLYSIDRWTDHHDEAEFQLVQSLLSIYKNRSSILRMTFSEAVTKFTNEYFDFIYIDGYAHTGQDNGKTLEEWYPKLKFGGVFAGHDYHDEWLPTKKVVDSFCERIRKSFFLTNEDKYPSWFFIK